VLEVALVAHEHDRNVRVGVVPKFLQPPRHVDVRGMLRDVVHQQRTDGTAVVSVRDPVSHHEKGGSRACAKGTDAEVIARYRSCPAVSQIWALTVFPSTVVERVANSTPIVDFESKLNSFLVKRESTTDPLTRAITRERLSRRAYDFCEKKSE
jgi:hypothetical protein